MDIEKENKRVQFKSKVPLPRTPLPVPLSQTLSKQPQEQEIKRRPLDTINRGAIPKTGNSKRNNFKTKCPLNADTRHVTVRQNQDLDWNYQVFEENVPKERNSVIIISDDEEEINEKKSEHVNYFTNHNEENCLGDETEEETPGLKSQSLEPNRTKTIKKSLESPHSRILQEISPEVQPDSRDERHKRRLEFTQFSQDRLHSPDNVPKERSSVIIISDNVPKERSSVIIISDDEEGIDEKKSKHVNYFTNHNEENCLGDEKEEETPTLKSQSLEPNRTKTIKKSLESPHSRILQEISPEVQPDSRDERHIRHTEITQFSQDHSHTHSPDFLQKSYMICLNRDYTEDFFPYLLSIENKTAVPRISSKIRACIINWLIKVNGLNGNPAVIQTTQSYFDAMLAAPILKSQIELYKVQLDFLKLVATACYWIAQKNHGLVYSAKKLVEHSSEAFTVKDLVAAEKAVMNKLNFPSQPVIPQEFITYLSWYCDTDNTGEIEVAATFLCMVGLMVDKSLCNEYPSVIGAAAVRNAVFLLRRNYAMDRLNMNSVYKSAESKVPNILLTCSSQRKAIRRMSSPYFKHKALLECYENGPLFIVQKVVDASNELAVVE